MKLSLVLISLVLCACSDFSVPGPDGGTITARTHPAGLPCGYPAGTLTYFTPAPPEVPAEK